MLTLSRTLATRLLKQAQTSPQQRVCGLLLGHNGQPKDIVGLPNVAGEPAHAYAIDPADYAGALASARTRDLEPMALYYSHPDSPPVPDAADLQAQPATDCLLLVISLNTKGVLEMRAFAPRDGRAAEIPVQIFL